MSSFLSLMLAIFKAIPALKEMFDSLITIYVESQIASMKKENKDAIKKAFETHDQRAIEEALGSQAGEHSGLADSELREELPDVKSSNPSI